MCSIPLLLALQLLAFPGPGTPICGSARPWPASFAAFYDSLNDVAYAKPSSIAFARTRADGNVGFNMKLAASHPHRASTDSAHVEFEFWMHTALEPGAIARAMYSIPDTVPLRVTLDDSTRMAWLVVTRRPWGQREQSAASSVSESMFIQAPAAQLAKLVSASSASMQLRGRRLLVNEAQLADWRAIARWAWCPAERPEPRPSPQ